MSDTERIEADVWAAHHASELRHWTDEAIKRNDRTYAALDQMLKNLPDGPEGPIHNAWADAERAQQTVRKTLIGLRGALHKLSEEAR